eukprot:CCRYP_020085-RA/>CCRYP_020085-RA protein AED:0.31 eAED:0.33 QI:0/0/0/1/0/0/3/0/131
MSLSVVVGKWNYLTQTSCSNILFASHLVAKYSSNPRREHGVLEENIWNKDFAQLNPSTAKSRKGWVIFYAKCPMIWSSKLQSQVALSTTEAKYITMSTTLWDIIPIMELMNEIRKELQGYLVTVQGLLESL